MAVRRVRVHGREVAGVAALASAAVAAVADASPTGGGWADHVVVAVATAVVVWSSASTSWALLGAAGTFGLAAAGTWWAAAAGAAAVGLACWIGWRRRDLSTWRAVAGGAAVLSWAGASWEGGVGALGWTTALALVLGGAMVVTGLQRRERRVRRIALWIGVAVAGVAVVSAGVAAVEAFRVRSAADDGREAIEQGLDALADGDDVGAAGHFVEASEHFAAADRAMSRPWVWPSRLVPVAAQHRAAVGDVSADAAAASRTLADVSLIVDVDRIRPVDGQIDLAEVERITPPVTEAHEALLSLRATIADAESPWLLGPLADPLDEAAAEFDDRIGTVGAAVEALEVLPRMLGAEEPQRYFIAFTTPAEARGTGGFMGSFAILTADEGHLEMTELGRTRDLNVSLEDGASIDAPDDWIARWGRFGLVDPVDGTASSIAWSNITISPHFPSTGEAIASLAADSGRGIVDAVFAFDPEVLAELVGIVGGVEVTDPDGSTRRLTRRNTTEFLLIDQYRVEETTERVDLLETVAGLVVDELLAGSIGSPADLVDRLGPMVDERRLVGWGRDAEVQSFFRRIGMHGALPDPAANDGWHVVVNNAGANKVDAYLSREAVYEAELDRASGEVTGRLEVTFTNDSPTTGFPEGIIGNYIGDPVGTNRMLLSVYTALPVVASDLDGEPWPVEIGDEAGWYTATNYVVIPPGSSATVGVDVRGVPGLSTVVPSPAEAEAAAGTYDLVVVTQPLADDPVLTVSVLDDRGRAVASGEPSPGVWHSSGGAGRAGRSDGEGDGG